MKDQSFRSAGNQADPESRTGEFIQAEPPPRVPPENVSIQPPPRGTSASDQGPERGIGH